MAMNDDDGLATFLAIAEEANRDGRDIIDRIYVETAFDGYCRQHRQVCNHLDPIRMRPREHRPAEPQTLAHLFRMATVSAREPVPHRPRWGGSIVEPYAPGQKTRRRKSA